jgi:hypothetical protein
MLVCDSALRIAKSFWAPGVLGSLNGESCGMLGKRLALFREQFPKPNDRVAYNAGPVVAVCFIA